MAPYNLEGRKVLITGGSKGLGSKIAHKFIAAGCTGIAINYSSDKSAAETLLSQLQHEYRGGVSGCCIRADAGSMGECERMVEEAWEKLGGLDVVVGNAGFTKFAPFGDLNGLTEEEWDKCWATNVKGPLALLRAAAPIFNSNPEGGCFIVTSSIAGISEGGSSMAYSVTKAAQLQLTKCMAKTQGPKIRCNAVLPGLLLTEWGLKYPPEVIAGLKKCAILQAETDLNDCADAFVMIAQNGSMTGQEITVDSGLNLSRTYAM